LITTLGLAAAVLAAGVPTGAAGTVTVALIGLLAVGAPLWAVALSGRIRDVRIVVPALVGLGLSGAGLDWTQADGAGFVAAYMALVGLALRAPRRIALLAGTPVVIAIAAAEAHDSTNPASTFLAAGLGAGFLFTTSAFAAFNQEARQHAEALLIQEAAAREAHEHAAALAERSRLARELHDVLAHSLSGLSVQLEVARLLATTTGADSSVTNQIRSAHRLAGNGMLNARRALRTLRGDEMPGPAALPSLISETASVSGLPIKLDLAGIPRLLTPEAGLTIYRTVQEALTNVAKHAGHGASAVVHLTWAPDSVEVVIADIGGDGVDAGLLSGGYGLTSMAERAALHGGRLDAGPTAAGFTVRLRLPIGSPAGKGQP
jgi:signal transduction histidine kinase